MSNRFGFAFPELVVESVIRDGLLDLKNNPGFLDDVLAELTKPYADRKYGTSEVQKVKTLIQEENIAVVHALHDGAAKNPAYSIQLGNDTEDKRTSHLDDFEADFRETTTDAATIASRLKETNVIPNSYNETTGMVEVPDTVDLSDVYSSYIYEDGSGNEFKLGSGISNTPGNKFFFIEPNQTPDISNPGELRSFLTEDQFEVRGVQQNVQILVGVHSKEPLLTKYLYVILKFVLNSRKKDLINRCLDRMTLQGSDFTRDLEFQGDRVYNRFLTVNGYVEDVWRSDQVNLIDAAEIEADPVEDC
jgi:hypothetical protein